MYGTIPLVESLAVALTDHIDRSPSKALLRGRRGYIHSWVLHENETSRFEEGVRCLTKLPRVVFVKFYSADGEECNWTVPGLSEPGLYPITCKKGTWFVDKGRQHPVLEISRMQLLLAPAFAITAHSAQGQTCKKGAIVDLRIGKGTNPISSYVAITRVQKREDLLIYRPFNIEPFQQGQLL